MKLQKLLIILLLVIFISACTQNPYKREFYGYTFNFRANLFEAEKVKVFPNENAIKRLLLDENLERVTIALPNVERRAGFYAVAGYEIAYKLTIIYKTIYQGVGSIEVFIAENNYTCMYFDDSEKTICIGKKLFDSLDEISPGENEVAIVLLGEEFADDTYVEVKGRKIFVKGKSFSEEKRTYTDLDLATAKLLLVLIESFG
jgi:hypothetical protein